MNKQMLWLLLLLVVALATACEAQPPSPSELAEANRKNSEANLNQAKASAVLKDADAKATATAQDSADKSKVAAAQAAAALAERDLTNAKAETERRLADVQVKYNSLIGQANVNAIDLDAWANAQRKIYQGQIDLLNSEIVRRRDTKKFELDQQQSAATNAIWRTLLVWIQVPLAYLLGVVFAAAGLMFVLYIRFKLTCGQAYVLVEPSFFTRLAANFTHQSLLTVVAEPYGTPRAFVEVWVRGPNAWRSYALEDSKAAQIAATLNGAAQLTSGVLNAAQTLPPDVAAQLTTLSGQAAAGVLQTNLDE